MSQAKKPENPQKPDGSKPVFGTQMPRFGAESAPVSKAVTGTVSASDTERAPRKGVTGTLFAPAGRSPLASMALGDVKVGSETHGLRLISKTHRADASEIGLLSAVTENGQRPTGGTRSPAGPAADPLRAEAGVTPAKRSVRGAGKSTWDLRIHKRDITGHMSGVVSGAADRDLTTDLDQLTGLRSAFAQGATAPEYEVLGELGAGSMGIVYRARQTSLNRELAIKTLKPASVFTEHDQEMFVSEAVVTANLVHPNIIPIHDLAHTADGKLFYSMKQVTGVSWDKVLPVRPQEENLDIFMKVCDAVAYAHSRGVINRDLKPENVVVGNYGEVVVLDWGLSITLDRFEKRNSVVVEFRGCAGTPVYMSPELADEDVSLVGPHSDIYLLGAILFEILEGFPPHFLRRFWFLTDPEEQLHSVVQAVLENEIEQDVRNRGELMQIARKAMSTRPEDRFRSVEEMQEAIREYRITGRAEELLREVRETGDSSYQDYQSAVALYGEALRKWPDNRRAVEGDSKARLAYAKLAMKKGDIDLGLQVTAGREEPDFRLIRSKLRKTRTIRRIVRGTWGVMSITAITLLFVVALLYVEADKAKAEAMSARDDAIAAENDALIEKGRAEAAATAANLARAELEQKNGTIEQLRAEERRLNEEVAKAREDAEKLVQQANDKVEAAEQQRITAQNKVKAAELELISAQKKVAEADQTLDSLRTQAAEARRESFRSQLTGFEIRIKAYEELGEYGRVIEVAEEALSKAGENELIDANKKKVFEEQIRAFRSRLDNSEMQLDQKPATSAVSGDGSTIAVYSRGTRPEILVFRGDASSTLLTDFSRFRLSAARGLVRHLAVSEDGQWICLTGKNIKQLWYWQQTEYVETAVPQDFPKSPAAATSSTFIKAVFSADSQRLYLFGSDENATVEIHSLRDGTARKIAEKTLSGDQRGGFSIRDAVVLNDDSAIIAQTSEFGCLAFFMTWKGDAVDFDKLHVRAPRLAGLDDKRITEAIYDPEQLVLSPDGQHLVLISGRSVLILPKSDEITANSFPFRSPNDIDQLEYFQTSFPVTDLAVSFDNSRIAAGDNKRYIQIWQLENGRYTPCTADGLYVHRKNAARSLRGHSEAIQALCFLPKSADSLISVGADSFVRSWNISGYGDYVSRFAALRGLLTPAAEGPAKVSAALPRRINFGQPIFASTHSETETANAETAETEATEAAVNAVRQSPISLRTGRRVYSARFSQDAQRVLVGTDDLAAHVFDSRTGRPVTYGGLEGRKELFFEPERNNFLEGHISEIASIKFLPPTGDLLLSADYFGSISVWDAVPDEDGIAYEKSRLLSEYSFSEFTTSDDGSLILAGGAITDETAPLEDAGLSHLGIVWRTSDIGNGPMSRPYRRLEGQHPRFAITAVALSPSGRLAMTAGRRGRIVIWNVEDGSVMASASGAHGRDQVSGGFFRTETELLTVGYDGRLFRWEISDGQLRSAEIPGNEGEPVPDFIIRMRPSPDRTRFITSEVITVANGTDKQRFLNFTIRSEAGERSFLPSPIRIPEQDKGKAFRHDISWSSDGRQLMVVTDGVISIYRTDDWSLMRRFLQDSKGVRAVRGSMAPTAPGRPQRIATFDGRFTHLWNMETGERLAEFRSHSISNVAADFSPEGRYVITGSESIRVFDADENSPNHGRTVFRFPIQDAHPGLVTDVRFSPRADVRMLASIDRHGGLKLWDWNPTRATPLQSIFSDKPEMRDVPDWAEGTVQSNVLAWSSDGRWLAAIQSGQLRLWSVNERKLTPVELKLPSDFAFQFNQIDFSAGSLLCAAGVAFDEQTAELMSYGLVWKTLGTEGVELTAFIEDGHPAELQSVNSTTGITAMAFDDSRDEILTGGIDGELIRWQIGDLASGTVRKLDRIARKSIGGDIEAPHQWPVSAIDVAADGRIVSADINGNLIIWPEAASR